MLTFRSAVLTGSILTTGVTIALALSGCVPNTPTGGSSGRKAVAVSLTDSACTVSTATASSGPVTFQISNTGSTVNEFEVLADDKLRIAGEKENIGPGTTVNYVVQLDEGNYFTACKKGMVGSPSSLAAFTVTKGTAPAVAEKDSALVARAVTNYTSYVRDQSSQLLTATTEFAHAYAAGDDDSARAQYAAARMHYERIEPTAEQFGDIDPALDLREQDVEAGTNWTGWHRIEKDLWPPAGYTPSVAATRSQLAQQLVDDTRKLNDLVSAKNFRLTLDQISNGASGLMEEVATSKITGEEEKFSHTDLWDFAANVEGAQVAYGTVKDIVKAKKGAGEKTAALLDKEFALINAKLAAYKTGDGYVLYTELTAPQIKELSDSVNALSEPLSSLTALLVK